MDGRGALKLSVFLLMAAGCQHQVMTVPSPGPQSSSNKPLVLARSRIKPATAQMKDQTPMVWVSRGDFEAGEASDPDRPPDRRQQFCESARVDYEQALKIDKKCVPAYQGLARLYTAMRDMPLAIETYHQALKITPKNAALWYELGICHNSQKNFEPALYCLNRAVQIDPGNRLFINAKGVVLAESGRYDESLTCFSRCGGEALGCYRLARTLERLQQPELSRRYLAAALEKDPSLASTPAPLNGGNGPANSADPVVQQTSYQAPASPAANVSAAADAPAATEATPPEASADEYPPAPHQFLLPPPPPVNVPYEQPYP